MHDWIKLKMIFDEKKEIFEICDQLGITYQAQDDGLNESLFYKDFLCWHY